MNIKGLLPDRSELDIHIWEPFYISGPSILSHLSISLFSQIIYPESFHPAGTT